VKLQQAIEPGAARPVKGAFERLERSDAKVSRAVLRGRGGGNAALLPDQKQSMLNCWSVMMRMLPKQWPTNWIYSKCAKVM
jgi:hypothetical protein